MSDGTLGVIPLVITFAFLIMVVAAFWKVFTKAGVPGWAAIIPIYNMIVFFRIASKPGWWLLLLFIPLINLIVTIIATAALAKRFGKSGGFTAGLVILPFIFYPILGFGDARYAAT